MFILVLFIIGENSHLIKECNQLRSENLSLSREVNHLRQVVKDHNTASAKRREKLRSHEKKSTLTYNTDTALSPTHGGPHLMPPAIIRKAQATPLPLHPDVLTTSIGEQH